VCIQLFFVYLVGLVGLEEVGLLVSVRIVNSVIVQQSNQYASSQCLELHFPYPTFIRFVVFTTSSSSSSSALSSSVSSSLPFFLDLHLLFHLLCYSIVEEGMEKGARFEERRFEKRFEERYEI